MTNEELGEVVILNCDNKFFDSPFDDVKNMPVELVSQLKKQLSNQSDHMGDRVSKIFLRVLVQLIGGYRDAVKFSQGNKLTWCRETFIESRPSHLRPFLRKMLELQIFQQFIEERLEMLNTGLGFSDEFELETSRYHEKPKRRIKPFLRNVKEKVSQCRVKVHSSRYEIVWTFSNAYHNWFMDLFESFLYRFCSIHEVQLDASAFSIAYCCVHCIF